MEFSLGLVEALGIEGDLNFVTKTSLRARVYKGQLKKKRFYLFMRQREAEAKTGSLWSREPNMGLASWDQNLR